MGCIGPHANVVHKSAVTWTVPEPEWKTDVYIFIILLCPVHTDYLVDQMLKSLVHTLSSVHKSLPHEDGVCSKKVDSADEDICVALTWMSRSATRTWEVSFLTFSTFHILLIHSSKPFKAHSTDHEHGLTHLAHAHYLVNLCSRRYRDFMA